MAHPLSVIASSILLPTTCDTLSFEILVVTLGFTLLWRDLTLHEILAQNTTGVFTSSVEPTLTVDLPRQKHGLHRVDRPQRQHLHVQHRDLTLLYLVLPQWNEAVLSNDNPVHSPALAPHLTELVTSPTHGEQVRPPES